MAEVSTSTQDLKARKKVGIRKSKKMSIRVDLTPMVDLGFLLITFFMVTTTMSQPNSMQLKMPDDNQNIPTNIPQSGALTILLGKNNHIYYFNGALKKDLSNVGLSNLKDIRKIILDKKMTTNPDNLFISVMPGNACTYKNIVDLLNEFSIDAIDRYALVNKVESPFEKMITTLDASTKNNK